MNLTFTPESIAGVVQRIEAANENFKQRYPGDVTSRQPVHTVYGGAHLFKADTAGKLGGIALRNMDAYAPNFVVFAKALGLPGAEALPNTESEIAHLAQVIAHDPYPRRDHDRCSHRRDELHDARHARNRTTTRRRCLGTRA